MATKRDRQVTLLLRTRKAAFDARCFAEIVREHFAFRRGRTDLGEVLRAYRAFHRDRAARVPWEMSDVHTIVITAHNHALFIPEAVHSVIQQDWRPIELIVVDDASDDDTQEVLARTLADLPPGVSARVIHNRRSLGQTGSVNLGTLAAQGSVLTMVDADDYLLAGAIPIAREMLREHQAFLFGGGARRFWGDLPEQRDVAPSADGLTTQLYTPERLLQHPSGFNISHTGSTYLRSAWRLVGGYRRLARTRITFAADREFHLRIGSLLPIVTAGVDVSHWRMGSSVNRGRFR